MPMATYDDFKKLEFKVGEVVEAELVAGSANLLRLVVDVGTERRQLVAGIAKAYSPAELVGKQIIVLANLGPKTIMGVESKGMLLAAVGAAGNVALLTVDRKIESGTPVE